MSSKTINDMETIEPPTQGKNKAGGKYNGGYPSIRELINRPSTGDLSGKKLMIVGSRGGASGFAQSSGGASEETKGKSKMNIKKILEKAKTKSKLEETMCNECGVYESKCACKKMQEDTKENFEEMNLHVSPEQHDKSTNTVYHIVHHDDKEIGTIGTNAKEHIAKHGKWGFEDIHGYGRRRDEPMLHSKDDAIKALANRHAEHMQKMVKEEIKLNEAGIETADDNNPKYGTDEVSRINYQFDNVFKNSFTNPYLIVNAVSAILERFSIQMPVIDPSGRNEIHVLHIHQEEGDLFVYIAIERNGRGHYDAFVQLVDKEGLSVLQSHDGAGEFDTGNTGNNGDRFNAGILKTSRRTDDN